MSFFLQGNPIFGTYFKHQGHLPTAFKDTGHSEDAPTNKPQTSLCLPWIGRILKKIYQGFYKDSKAVNLAHKTTSQI